MKIKYSLSRLIIAIGLLLLVLIGTTLMDRVTVIDYQQQELKKEDNTPKNNKDEDDKKINEPQKPGE